MAQALNAIPKGGPVDVEADHRDLFVPEFFDYGQNQLPEGVGQRSPKFRSLCKEVKKIAIDTVNRYREEILPLYRTARDNNLDQETKSDETKFPFKRLLKEMPRMRKTFLKFMTGNVDEFKKNRMESWHTNIQYKTNITLFRLIHLVFQLDMEINGIKDETIKSIMGDATSLLTEDRELLRGESQERRERIEAWTREAEAARAAANADARRRAAAAATNSESASAEKANNESVEIEDLGSETALDEATANSSNQTQQTVRTTEAANAAAEAAIRRQDQANRDTSFRTLENQISRRIRERETGTVPRRRETNPQSTPVVPQGGPIPRNLFQSNYHPSTIQPPPASGLELWSFNETYETPALGERTVGRVQREAERIADLQRQEDERFELNQRETDRRRRLQVQEGLRRDREEAERRRQLLEEIDEQLANPQVIEAAPEPIPRPADAPPPYTEEGGRATLRRIILDPAFAQPSPNREQIAARFRRHRDSSLASLRLPNLSVPPPPIGAPPTRHPPTPEARTDRRRTRSSPPASPSRTSTTTSARVPAPSREREFRTRRTAEERLREVETETEGEEIREV